jgi:excisionase family DNA binding protein
MPDEEWLSTGEAAEILGVSSERVRQLAQSGKLPARRTPAGWIIPISAVANLQLPGRGRLITPKTAWQVITALDVRANIAAAKQAIADRRARYRIMGLIDDLPDPENQPEPWRRVLGGRGYSTRMRAHRGVVQHAAADSRVAVGGSDAMPGRYGLTKGRTVLYVSNAIEADVTAQYHLSPDRTGQITLVTVPAGLEPRGGFPVPAPAAAADLLDEDDPRARHAGANYLKTCVTELRDTGWLHYADQR